MRFFAAAILAALLFANAAVGADQNNIQALVGDAIITRFQVLSAAALEEQPYYEQYLRAPTLANSNALAAKSAAAREGALEYFINFNLVMQEFKSIEEKLAKQNIKPIPESEVDKLVQDDIQKPQFGGDRVRFIKFLQNRGETLEQYRSELKDTLVFQAMRGQFVPEPIVSPKQIEDYYREHQDKYKVAERVKMRTIFLKKTADNADAAKNKAEEIHALLKSGSSFKDLAKTYSEIPGAATDGNEDPEWVELEGKSQAIRDAVAKIKPGEFSDVVETGEGFFIVLLEARDPAHVRQLNDLEDSPRAQIEQDLKNQERDRRTKAWFKRLERKTFLDKF
jgi:peptidyl-prolyl cis-trans isomerase SurA